MRLTYKKSKYCLLSVQHGFGSPVVRGTNIKCSTLKSMYKGGDSIDLLAELYDLSLEQVRARLLIGATIVRTIFLKCYFFFFTQK